MTTTELLNYFEQNIIGWEKIECFMRSMEDYSGANLKSDFEIDEFKGYEGLFPLFLMSSVDAALVRTYKRLFLRWFADDVEKRGVKDVFDMVWKILEEEQERHKKRKAKICTL